MDNISTTYIGLQEDEKDIVTILEDDDKDKQSTDGGYIWVGDWRDLYCLRRHLREIIEYYSNQDNYTPREGEHHPFLSRAIKKLEELDKMILK